MPLFSLPSEVNPVCPSAWLPPESVITINWEIAAEMLQEWALFYMLHPLTKKMFIACMFSHLPDILFLKNHCWLEDRYHELMMTTTTMMMMMMRARPLDLYYAIFSPVSNTIWLVSAQHWSCAAEKLRVSRQEDAAGKVPLPELEGCLIRLLQ